MNKESHKKLILLFLLAGFYFNLIQAQVGIGTITPDPSSILDITDTSGSKGLLIPRVALTSTNLSAPVTPTPATSLLVFNTANAGSGVSAVYPGYYYWDSSKWVALVGSEKWDLLGNNGTNQGANFIGTTDAQGLTFRTNNIERFRVANGNQVLAMKDGTSILPFYSWNADNDTGIYRITANTLGFSSNKLERIRIGASEFTVNELQKDYDFRIKSMNQEDLFVTKGSTNKIGVNTNNPQTTLHIAGNSSTLRIEELNMTNNIHNVEADPAPVYVNNNGDLILQPTLTQTFMPINDLNFLGNGVSISSNGNAATRLLLAKDITLTQESLVQINYHVSVDVTRYGGDPITDGATRLFRSYVSVDGSANYLAVGTGNYTNYSTGGSGGTYANGYFYLSGTGYMQLSAGAHTIKLSVLGFGGDFDYKMNFGVSEIERFQVIVHR